MKPTRIAMLLLSLSGIAFTAPSHAIAYYGTYSSILWNTPGQYFTDDDWKLFENTLNNTLNTAKDGETRAWANPATKASGEFTILRSVQRGDNSCREVKIISQAQGRRRVLGKAFCKQDDGTWKVVSGR